MSRYLERAEHTARLLDVVQHTLLDVGSPGGTSHWEPLLASTGDLEAFLRAYQQPEAPQVSHFLAFGANNPNAIVQCVSHARENARQVREQISSEMWECLNSLYLQLRAADLRRISEDEPHRFYHAVKNGSHLFQGITDATLTHGEGWHFIQVGRFLERANQTARLLDVQYERLRGGGGGPQEYLEWVAVLKSCSAWEAYCKVYSAQATPRQVAAVLALYPEFPRSICFAARAMRSSLRAIAQASETRVGQGLDRLIGRLCAQLDYTQVDELVASGLHLTMVTIQQQCAEIHSELYQTYVGYAVEQVV
jgi:uncharacterized alpha-E superfamily protein